MTELILRAATTADIPAISRLAIDSFVAKFGPMYRAEDLATFLAESYSQDAIAAELANPDRLYRLAEREGQLLLQSGEQIRQQNMPPQLDPPIRQGFGGG